MDHVTDSKYSTLLLALQFASAYSNNGLPSFIAV